MSIKTKPEELDHEKLSLGPVLQNWQAVLAVNLVTHLHLMARIRLTNNYETNLDAPSVVHLSIIKVYYGLIASKSLDGIRIS